MQFGDSDNLHYQPQETSRDKTEALCFFWRRFNKLLRSPLTFVFIVWGLLFMILGLILAYAQEVSHDASRQHPTASSRKAVNHTAYQRSRR